MTGTHCESCGSTEYEDLELGDQGYTACCNELKCHGDGRYRFGTNEKNTVACCWAVAIKAGVTEGSRMGPAY